MKRLPSPCTVQYVTENLETNVLRVQRKGITFVRCLDGKVGTPPLSILKVFSLCLDQPPCHCIRDRRESKGQTLHSLETKVSHRDIPSSRSALLADLHEVTSLARFWQYNTYHLYFKSEPTYFAYIVSSHHQHLFLPFLVTWILFDKSLY